MQKMCLAQNWRGNRLVKFIFGVTKTWNAPWCSRLQCNQVKGIMLCCSLALCSCSR